MKILEFIFALVELLSVFGRIILATAGMAIVIPYVEKEITAIFIIFSLLSWVLYHPLKNIIIMKRTPLLGRPLKA